VTAEIRSGNLTATGLMVYRLLLLSRLRLPLWSKSSSSMVISGDKFGGSALEWLAGEVRNSLISMSKVAMATKHRMYADMPNLFSRSWWSSYNPFTVAIGTPYIPASSGSQISALAMVSSMVGSVRQRSDRMVIYSEACRTCRQATSSVAQLVNPE